MPVAASPERTPTAAGSPVLATGPAPPGSSAGDRSDVLTPPALFEVLDRLDEVAARGTAVRLSAGAWLVFSRTIREHLNELQRVYGATIEACAAHAEGALDRRSAARAIRALTWDEIAARLAAGKANHDSAPEGSDGRPPA